MISYHRVLSAVLVHFYHIKAFAAFGVSQRDLHGIDNLIIIGKLFSNFTEGGTRDTYQYDGRHASEIHKQPLFLVSHHLLLHRKID